MRTNKSIKWTNFQLKLDSWFIFATLIVEICIFTDITMFRFHLFLPRSNWRRNQKRSIGEAIAQKLFNAARPNKMIDFDNADLFSAVENSNNGNTVTNANTIPTSPITMNNATTINNKTASMGNETQTNIDNPLFGTEIQTKVLTTETIVLLLMFAVCTIIYSSEYINCLSPHFSLFYEWLNVESWEKLFFC